MKHLFLFVLSFSLVFFSCNDQEDLITKEVERTETSKNSRLKLGENIKVLKYDTRNYRNYLAHSSNVFEVEVEVANLAYNKKVVVHYQNSNGAWTNFNLTYKNTTNKGTEIWSGKLILGSASDINGEISQFVVKYEVKGQTYWDNNKGKNYKTPAEGTFLADDLNVSVSHGYLYPDGRFGVIVNVKNLAPTKEVKLIYTLDNWKTTQTDNLKYQSSWFYGQGDIPSPNIHKVEVWWFGKTFSTLTFSEIKYAVVYKVNGVEYWDNNFGKNYTVTFN